MKIGILGTGNVGQALGSHQGAFLGVAPSGNELSWNGLALFRVVDGKITERWFNSDSLNIVQQLGLFSSLA